VAILTKKDLAEAVEFDWPAAQANIQAVRPGMQMFFLSSKSGEGMGQFLEYLVGRLVELRTAVTV
jgi:hydrogenase nickel incorporation protein HypB